ncbi:ribonuclease P protein component [Egibacter rhizosphaerae]|uniref:Ribonuclease P protein component n=1 Tax=Egibacter rhizosphaerae TaxID=1670831 RepID=A0A411YFR2_9ACTN|nr:ribonuclease P protein component [Egibacter rhizosphaerae]
MTAGEAGQGAGAGAVIGARARHAPARLRRSGEVRAVLARRQRRTGRYMVVHGHDRGDSAPPRATVVAGRRVGRAVDRNRAKRRLRAGLREVGVEPGHDVVVVARPRAVTAPFKGLCSELAALLPGGRDGAPDD